MFSFTLIFGQIIADDYIERIRRTYINVSKNFPIQTDLTVSSYDHDINLICTKPSESKISKLHHIFNTNEYFVYTYGNLFGEIDLNLSKFLLDIYLKSGENAVRSIDGHFSFILFNKYSKSILILSDSVGDRRIHYFLSNTLTFLSSSDILLYSTGLLSKKINRNSIIEMLGFSSSRIGDSILEDIKNIKPYEIIKIFNNKVESKYDSNFTSLEPVYSDSQLKNITKGIIGRIKTKSSVYINFAQTIEFDLTAGKDTRSIFGLLKDIVDKNKTVIRTRGEVNCIDNVTAQRIAKIYNFKHINVELENISEDQYANNLHAFAFFSNGNTNGMRAIENIVFKDIDLLRFGGVRTTPEAFRIPSIKNRNNPIDEIYNYFISKYFNFSYLNELDRNNYKTYFCGIIKEIYQLNSNIDFVLKALTFFALFSNSGILINQRNWQLQNIEPFLSQEIANLYFLTPINKLHDFTLYPEIIFQYAKELSQIPVNGNIFYKICRRKNMLLIKTYSMYIKLKKKLKPNLKNKNIFQDSIGNAYKNIYKNLIIKEFQNSEINENNIFSDHILHTIIDEHFKGTKNNQDIIGNLLIIERFLKLLKLIDNDLTNEKD